MEKQVLILFNLEWFRKKLFTPVAGLFQSAHLSILILRGSLTKLIAYRGCVGAYGSLSTECSCLTGLFKMFNQREA